jgi:hypothetical protein
VAIVDAATADVVDVLADRLLARDALAWLDRHHLGDDPVLDRLAATYLARGEGASAGIVNARLPATHDRALECHRRLRDVRAGTLDALPATCGGLADAAHCPLVSGRTSMAAWHTADQLQAIASDELVACGALAWRDSRVDAQARLWVAAIALHWPAGTTESAVWVAYARAATSSWWNRDVELLALAALANAAGTADCQDADERAPIRAAALAMRDHEGRDPSLDARVDGLSALSAQTCSRFPRL